MDRQERPEIDIFGRKARWRIHITGILVVARKEGSACSGAWTSSTQDASILHGRDPSRSTIRPDLRKPPIPPHAGLFCSGRTQRLDTTPNTIRKQPGGTIAPSFVVGSTTAGAWRGTKAGLTMGFGAIRLSRTWSTMESALPSTSSQRKGSRHGPVPRPEPWLQTARARLLLHLSKIGVREDVPTTSNFSRCTTPRRGSRR